MQVSFVVKDSSSARHTTKLTESLMKIPTNGQSKSNNSTAPASVVDLPNEKTQAKLPPTAESANGGRYHIRQIRKKKVNYLKWHWLTISSEFR